MKESTCTYINKLFGRINKVGPSVTKHNKEVNKLFGRINKVGPSVTKHNEGTKNTLLNL